MTFVRKILFRVAPLCLALAGCAEPSVPATGLGGGNEARPVSSLYRSMAAPGAHLDAEAARAMISLYRGNQGQPPLALDPGLMAAAQAQADAMAKADKLSHEVRGSLTERLDRAGFPKSAAVENVSAGYDTIAEVFSGWRQSTPHNANMLAPRMTRMGIAATYNPRTRYKVFWSLVLAN